MAEGWRAALQNAWTHRGLVAWLLWPVSLLFSCLVAFRWWLYSAGLLKSQALPVPVIVVGNVVVGGVGKTPVVMALVQHFQGQGITVGVISRGYGRTTQDCREVTPDSIPSTVGDEPLLIRKRTGASVFVASKRVDAGLALLKAFPATQIIICDDGLQHFALQRDIELCVFDDRGIGNGFLLPAGLLREPWPRKALHSFTQTPPKTLPAFYVLHTGAKPMFSGFNASRHLASRAMRADGSQATLAELAANASLSLIALAGIGQPELFFAQLRAQGLTLEETHPLPDHFDFDSWSRLSGKHLQIICTEKDAVKLWKTDPLVLAVPLDVILDPALLAHMDQMLSTKLSSHPFCL